LLGIKNKNLSNGKYGSSPNKIGVQRLKEGVVCL